MSIWTSKPLRLGLALLAPFALSACLSPGAGGIGAGFLAQPKTEAAPLRKLALYDGAVVVAGPPGFCIDPRSTRRRSGGQFVVLASCAGLSGAPDMSGPMAVITLLVLPYDAGRARPSAQEIATSMAPAKPLKQVNSDTLSLVHLASGGNDAIPGSDPRHWRGATVINGHLIGLAAYGATGSKIAGTGGRTILTKTAQILRGASPKPAPKTASGAAQTTPKPRAKNPLASLLSAITQQ